MFSYSIITNVKIGAQNQNGEKSDQKLVSSSPNIVQLLKVRRKPPHNIKILSNKRLPIVSPTTKNTNNVVEPEFVKPNNESIKRSQLAVQQTDSNIPPGADLLFQTNGEWSNKNGWITNKSNQIGGCWI